MAASAPERYEATADLLIRDTELSSKVLDGPAVIGGQPPLAPDTSIGLLELDGPAQLAAKRLGLSKDDVANNVDFAGGAGPELIEVTASDDDPQRAAEIANAVSVAYVELRREADQRVIEVAIEAVEAQVKGLDRSAEGSAEEDVLRRELADLRTLPLLQTGGAEIAAPADPPESPASSGALRNGIVGGFAGFVAGTIVALLLARLRPRVQNRRGFERAYGTPVLAEIPSDHGLLGPEPASELGEAEREALRSLWTRLRFADPDSPMRTVLVSSVRTGAGVSSTALGMAKVVAAEGFRTTIVDANLRRPALAGALGLDPEPGLSGYLAGEEHDLVDLLRAVSGSGPDGEGELLGLLPSGATPSNPAGLLGTESAADLAERLGDEADLVIFDVPALGAIADGLPLVHQVDGVLLVDRPGLTGEEAAAQLVGQLQGFGAVLLGVVLIDAPARAE